MELYSISKLWANPEYLLPFHFEDEATDASLKSIVDPTNVVLLMKQVPQAGWLRFLHANNISTVTFFPNTPAS